MVDVHAAPGFLVAVGWYGRHCVAVYACARHHQVVLFVV